MKNWNEEQRKEFEKFTLNQMKILQGHFDRCMLRIINKIGEIEVSELSTKASVSRRNAS